MIDDLQKLPPQAIAVIRFLAGREHAAASDLIGGTGLSERAFGKAIRALVTRHFAEMPQPGVYRLSERGRQALAMIDAEQPSDLPDAAPAAPTAPSAPSGPSAFSTSFAPAAPVGTAPAGPVKRRLSVLVAREWVRHLPARLMVGFDAATDAAASGAAQTLLLRVKAPGCLIDPSEQTLRLPPRKPAGPVQFRLTPHEGRVIRVQIEVYRESALLGGLFFEVPVSELPTPLSAQFHALGSPVSLGPRV